MIRGPFVGMLSRPDSSRPKYARHRRWTPGRARSRRGVRTALYTTQKTGAGSLRPRQVGDPSALQLVVVSRLQIFLGRYELAPLALEPVLAPNARRDFRERLKPRGRDLFFAFDTRSVVAVLQAF